MKLKPTYPPPLMDLRTLRTKFIRSISAKSIKTHLEIDPSFPEAKVVANKKYYLTNGVLKYFTDRFGRVVSLDDHLVNQQILMQLLQYSAPTIWAKIFKNDAIKKVYIGSRWYVLYSDIETHFADRLSVVAIREFEPC